MSELRARIWALSGISRLSIDEYMVWEKYVSLGGRATWFEFRAYLYEALDPSKAMRLRIDHAVWEIEQFGPP